MQATKIKPGEYAQKYNKWATPQRVYVVAVEDYPPRPRYNRRRDRRVYTVRLDNKTGLANDQRVTTTYTTREISEPWAEYEKREAERDVWRRENKRRARAEARREKEAVDFLTKRGILTSAYTRFNNQEVRDIVARIEREHGVSQVLIGS